MKIDLTDPKFMSSIVGRNWYYCFNADCPRTGECVRFLATKFKPKDVTCGCAIYPDATLDGPCKHFCRVIVVKTAWGLSHLYDDVKHKDAHIMKYAVMNAMGSRTSYYRINRGEKHLFPEGQEAVKQVFADYGYGEPRYDYYGEEISFKYD